MASLLNSEPWISPKYQGLSSIFEYVNQDGKLAKWNCGQAAAATLLTALGKFAPDAARDTMRWIETHYPPDQAGGWFGSSRRRVTKICKSMGVNLDEIEGEDALKTQLALGNPVLLMLGVKAGSFWGYNLPGGHWVVAYGYDETNLYLTNWDQEPLPWGDFEHRWRSFVSRVIQMSNRGLVARPTHVE